MKLRGSAFEDFLKSRAPRFFNKIKDFIIYFRFLFVAFYFEYVQVLDILNRSAVQKNSKTVIFGRFYEHLA